MRPIGFVVLMLLIYLLSFASFGWGVIRLGDRLGELDPELRTALLLIFAGAGTQWFMTRLISAGAAGLKHNDEPGKK